MTKNITPDNQTIPKADDIKVNTDAIYKDSETKPVVVR